MPEQKRKHTPLVLIARFFGIPLKEMKTLKDSLGERDRIELASAIARELEYPDEDLSFTPVPY